MRFLNVISHYSNQLIGQLNDANKKVEEANLTLGDFENHKRKIAAENSDLLSNHKIDKTSIGFKPSLSEIALSADDFRRI